MSGNFLSMQAEEIILTSDVEEYVLQIKYAKVLIIQVYDSKGILKNLRVTGNIISPNGKTVLLKGDIIKYIAVY